jgi:putative peptidoglycan lipid II flippase
VTGPQENRVRERAQKFWYEISQKKLTIPSAALILAVTSLISNFLGVYRERLIAGQFGASHLTDVFYASFKIPDLIFNLLVLGAVSSAFIPVFVDSLPKKNKEESNLIASNFMNFLLVATIIFGIVIFVLARKLVPFLLPGFFANGVQADFNTFEVAVTAVRIMILSPVFFAISSVFSGVLNSYKKFVAYSLAPIVYNLAIIFGIVFLSGKTGSPIYGLLYGVILGAVLHALVQLPSAIASGFRWKPVLDFRGHELPKIIKLMVPRTIAIGVGQINILVDTVVASYFVGGITMLNFANNIQTLPTVVFGISIATAVFPLLAEQSSPEKKKEFITTFSESARKILYFMIPASLGIIVLRAQIVRLLYGVGSFDWTNTYWTTKALGFFAIGLIAQGLTPLLVRTFYAIKDTKTPLIISLIVMLTNLIFSVTLPFIPRLDLGIAGVALAYSIAGFVNVILLFWFLHGKIGALDKDNKIFASTTRLLFSAVVMGIVAHYSLYLFDPFVDTHTVLGLLLQTCGAITLGAITYFGLSHLFRCDEAGYIFRKSI